MSTGKKRTNLRDTIGDTEKINDTDEITVIDKAKKKSRLFPPHKGAALTVNFTVIHGIKVDFGKHFHFSLRAIGIGRDKANSISLDDEKISKRHCEVSIVRYRNLEQVIVKDLRSTNGTYVNGELVQQAVLQSGDKIGIGDTVLLLNYNDEIEDEYHSKLFNFAAIDALTGLYNRRYIVNELENHCRIARRNNRRFGLVVIDIDNFKSINSAFGHMGGDEYLKKLAFVVNRCLREQDICGRFGGEEFLIILPETALEGGIKLADRIRDQLEKTEVVFNGKVIRTTISVGISQFGLHGEDSDTLFATADKALERAKKTGKNKVLAAEETTASGKRGQRMQAASILEQGTVKIGGETASINADEPPPAAPDTHEEDS
ncbi:MAG: GGDEF domain-containing protein [bacterium]|nr:GGDEF domain-containing protein [bacterium]